MPATIKRYPNRKLYDTAGKKYISLNEVASLVQRGEEVSILDNDTGEDLTALTLAQILIEQEKKQTGFLPGEVLAGLVQAGGGPADRLRKKLIGPLGMGRLVDEELKRRIDLLVQQNELTQAEGRRILLKLMQAGEQGAEPSFIEQAIDKFLVEQGIPTHQEFLRLMADIDALEEQVEKL